MKKLLLVLAMAPAFAADPPQKPGGTINQQWLTEAPVSSMTLSPCSARAEGCYLTLVSENGEQLVSISMRTGKVTLTHPEKADAAARHFWRAIEVAFGRLPCQP